MTILLSTVAAPFYIPHSSAQEHKSLHALTNTYYFLGLVWLGLVWFLDNEIDSLCCDM